MTTPRTRHRLAAAFLAWLVAAAAQAGQETLAQAKNLYIQAEYDEALVVLNRLHETASPPESSEIAGYQAFCLLALGRTDDAKQAIADLVKADPLYRPSDATTSPRTRAVFDEVRQGLLPGIVREIYDQAKAAFDRDEPSAGAGFDRVLTLLNEPALSKQPNTADLRRLATGFRDLGRSKPVPAAAPAETANAAHPVGTTGGREPAAPVFAPGDAGVVPPVTLSRPTPSWHPQTEIEKIREFRGMLEVLVDERGEVVTAGLVKSVHPKYDARLLEAAQTWKFRPATKDGVPVRYRAAIEIRLGPGQL